MSQEWNNNAGGEEDLQALGAESAGSHEGSSSGRKFIHINTSTLTLVMAFATAVVMLYLLGLHNKPKPASASDIKKNAETDSLITTMLHNTQAQNGVKSLFAETDKLVDLLNGYFKSSIKPMVLDDNPFGHEEPVDPIPLVQGHGDPTPPPPQADPRLRELSEEFATLKVQTVMMGSSPAALVNDQMVSIGSTLGSFKVVDISPDHLILGWQDKKFTLNVGAPPSGKH